MSTQNRLTWSLLLLRDQDTRLTLPDILRKKTS